MSNGQREYTVVSQVHTARTDQLDGQVKEGWEVTIQDTVTGVGIPFFVPDSRYTAEGVDEVARFHLNTVRAVHGLGG